MAINNCVLYRNAPAHPATHHSPRPSPRRLRRSHTALAIAFNSSTAFRSQRTLAHLSRSPGTLTHLSLAPNPDHSCTSRLSAPDSPCTSSLGLTPALHLTAWSSNTTTHGPAHNSVKSFPVFLSLEYHSSSDHSWRGTGVTAGS